MSQLRSTPTCEHTPSCCALISVVIKPCWHWHLPFAHLTSGRFPVNATVIHDFCEPSTKPQLNEQRVTFSRRAASPAFSTFAPHTLSWCDWGPCSWQCCQMFHSVGHPTSGTAPQHALPSGSRWKTGRVCDVWHWRRRGSREAWRRRRRSAAYGNRTHISTAKTRDTRFLPSWTRFFSPILTRRGAEDEWYILDLHSKPIFCILFHVAVLCQHPSNFRVVSCAYRAAPSCSCRFRIRVRVPHFDGTPIFNLTSHRLSAAFFWC